jgi:hypothetical protein
VKERRDGGVGAAGKRGWCAEDLQPGVERSAAGESGGKGGGKSDPNRKSISDLDLPVDLPSGTRPPATVQPAGDPPVSNDMSRDSKPQSFMRSLLFGLAAFAGLFALVAAFSALGGGAFNITAAGAGAGIPLPTGWTGFAVLAATAGLLYGGSRVWDRPGFETFRRRRPWALPALGVVLLPIGFVFAIALMH